MPASRGESEPMRLLDEFAGDAIVFPDATLNPETTHGRGVNAGMTTLPEHAVDLSQLAASTDSQPTQPPAPAPLPVVAGLAALIDLMADPVRSILRLRLAGQTPDQIAGTLGLPVEAVVRLLRTGAVEVRGLFHDYERRLLAG